MKRYINELKRIAKQKKITLKKLSKEVGMTEVGFHQAIKNNTLRFDVVMKMCEILGVSLADLDKRNENLIVNEKTEIYGNDEQTMIKEILKTVKRIEKQTDKLK